MIAAWCSFDVKKVAGLKINSPSNGLLLNGSLDPVFSSFKLWFEKTVRHLSPCVYNRLHLFNILGRAQQVHSQDRSCYYEIYRPSRNVR